MKKTQYEIELQEVIDKGGDIEAFKEEWFERTVNAYQSNVRTKEDVHKFRSGGFKI